MDTEPADAVRARNQALFARSLELIEVGAIREWVDLFAPDGVLEFSYPPPGIPARFAGHDALYAHMKTFPDELDLTFSGLTFHDTVDPDLVIAEFVGDGTSVPTGRPVHQTYLSVVRFAGGRITLFRDFWNPLVVIEALGGRPGALLLKLGRIVPPPRPRARKRRRAATPASDGR
jgi:uncharacterized protein